MIASQHPEVTASSTFHIGQLVTRLGAVSALRVTDLVYSPETGELEGIGAMHKVSGLTLYGPCEYFQPFDGFSGDLRRLTADELYKLHDYLYRANTRHHNCFVKEYIKEGFGSAITIQQDWMALDAQASMDVVYAILRERLA